MKQMLIAAAIIAASATTAVASENTFAPQQGDFSAEIQFNPFSNDFETFKIDQLQGRYFFSNKDAVRFGIGFGVSTNKNTADPDENPDNWTKNREGNFSINLGYERHFFNFKRVDLYAGAGLGFELVSTCTTNQTVREINGAKLTTQERIYNAGSYNLFTFNAFTGIDFYVYKGLYLGAELGIKIGVKNFPGQYTKGDFNDNGVWDDNLESKKGAKTSNFDFGTYCVPALRLGWKF